MIDRVVLESRHKFVYYDNNKDKILDMVSRYPARIDSDSPILVYIKDNGLPKMDNKLGLNKYKIKSIHNNYYSLLIFFSIIDTLIRDIDIDVLNSRLKRTFKFCSFNIKEKIRDVVTLRDKLLKSKNDYRDAYIKYMETGKLDLFDKIEIPFIIVDSSVEDLKEEIRLKEHFSLLLEIGADLSIYNYMAVNNYIASRCNGYLSMNVLCRDNEWGCYYTSNGQFIEYVHDYTEIMDEKTYSKRRSMYRSKKEY